MVAAGSENSVRCKTHNLGSISEPESFLDLQILNTNWSVLTGEGKRLPRTLLLGKSTQTVSAGVVYGQLAVALYGQTTGFRKECITHAILRAGR